MIQLDIESAVLDPLRNIIHLQLHVHLSLVFSRLLFIFLRVFYQVL